MIYGSVIMIFELIVEFFGLGELWGLYEFAEGDDAEVMMAWVCNNSGLGAGIGSENIE